MNDLLQRLLEAQWSEEEREKLRKMGIGESKVGYWYHISKKNHGHNITFAPIADRAWEDAGIPRICVSDTVEGCMVAVSCLFSSFDTIYVYKTVKEVEAFEPTDTVEDKEVTGEMWIFDQTKFRMDFKIDLMDMGVEEPWLLDELMNLRCGNPDAVNSQKRTKKKVKEYLSQAALGHITEKEPPQLSGRIGTPCPDTHRGRLPTSGDSRSAR